MASSVSPSLSASQTESQSSRGPNITHWLPQLMLGALLAVGGASIIGLALSAVAFARPEEELVKRGHGVAQCFVLFASMLSLFYIPLHILATLKGESLYPQIPLLHAQILPRSFRHELHAWASMAIQIAVVMWATAIIPVAVGIHRGPDARSTVHLKVDMFVCATGLVFSAILLVVVKVAERPFCLPWLSRKPAREEDNNTTRDFDSLKFEKQSSVGDNTSEEGSSTTSGSPRSPRSIHDAPSITTGSASVTATTASRSSSSARVLRTTRHRTKGGEGCSGSHRRSPRRCIWPTYASQAHPHHPQAVPLAMPVPVPMAMPMPMEMPIGIATMGIPIQPQRARASSCSSTAASTLLTPSNTGSSSGDITPATSVCPSTVGDPPPSDVGSGGGKEGNDKSATAPGPPPPPPDAVTQSRPLPPFGGSTSSSSGQESVTATASSEVSGQPARKKPRLMTSRDPMGRGGGGAPGWTGWGWYTAAGQASVGGGGDHPAPLMDRGRGKLVHPPPPPPPPPAGRRPGPPGPRGVERESPLVIRFRRKAGTTHPPGGAGTSVPEPQKRVEAERGKEGEKSGGEKKDEKYLKQQEGGNDDGETVKGSEDKGGKSDGPSAADQAQQKVYWVPGGWLPQGVLAEEEN